MFLTQTYLNLSIATGPQMLLQKCMNIGCVVRHKTGKHSVIGIFYLKYNFNLVSFIISKYNIYIIVSIMIIIIYNQIILINILLPCVHIIHIDNYVSHFTFDSAVSNIGIFCQILQVVNTLQVKIKS